MTKKIEDIKSFHQFWVLDKGTTKRSTVSDLRKYIEQNLDFEGGNLHSHANKTVLDGISATDVSNWDKTYPAEAFTSAEVTNLRAGKLDDGSAPWTLNNYYDSNNVDTHLSGGAGINYNMGEISIDDSVALKTYVTLDNATSNGNTTANSISVGGISSSGNITASGEVTAYSSSDVRLKKEVQTFTADYLLNKMNPVNFKWNAKAKALNPAKDDKKKYGLIAQELTEVAPELVQEIYDGYKAIDYEQIISILIQGFKEQKSDIIELKAKLNTNN